MTAPAQRFLVPVDGSAAAAAALDVAASLARGVRGTLTLLVVAPLAPLGADPLTSAGTDQPERQQLLDRLAREQADELAARLGPGLDLRTSLSWGPVGPAVVDQAETGEFDAVVIAWPEHGALWHLLHDHAARHVLDRCRLPVLVVPADRDARR